MSDEPTERDVEALAPCPHHPADCDGTACAAKRRADALAPHAAEAADRIVIEEHTALRGDA